MAANSRFAVATHIMAGLSLQENKLFSSTSLAVSVNTNPVVVRRILGDLQRAGLVETVAGKAGGSRLARSPNAINLSDIFAAVEAGELFAFNSSAPNRHCALSCEMKTILEPVFRNACRALSRELEKVPLSAISKRAKAVKKSHR